MCKIWHRDCLFKITLVPFFSCFSGQHRQKDQLIMVPNKGIVLDPVWRRSREWEIYFSLARQREEKEGRGWRDGLLLCSQ